MHGTRSAGLKKLFHMSPSTVLVLVLAIQTASNCWLPALNIAVVHGLLHIVGKVRGCFILVKKQQHVDLCTLASHLQTQPSQYCRAPRHAQFNARSTNKLYIKKCKMTTHFPMIATQQICVGYVYDHIHSRCVAWQSSGLIR